MGVQDQYPHVGRDMPSVYDAHHLPHDQAELIRLAERIIAEKFAPGEISRVDRRTNTEEGYTFFDTLGFFKSGFITADVIKRLQSGATALSVGVGDAHLEKLLVEGFDINSSHIMLADRADYMTTEAKYSTSPQVTFDMTEEWPDFEQPFSLILFPESLEVVAFDQAKIKSPKSVWDTVPEPIKQIREKLEEEKPISQEEVAAYLAATDKVKPFLREKVAVIKRALGCLADSGEIRISDTGMPFGTFDTLPYLRAAFYEHEPPLEISANTIVSIKKPSPKKS